MVIGTPTVLNLIPGGVMKIIHVNQVNENIEIQFRIMNGAQPFNVPEGVSCTIRGTKGDNFGYAAAVAVTAGSNIVTVTLTEQLTAVAGAGNIFELVFVGASDNMKVSTENFILEVERAALGEDTVISDSDLAYADQVLDQLQSVGAVNAQVQQNKANIAAEITRATAAEQTLQSNINAEAAARQAADNTLQSNINAEASSRATTDASLQSQIDQLIAPSGSAPSAAEVENARIGSDGTVYPTLGDAIRTQNSLLKSHLSDIGLFSLTSDFIKQAGGCISGVWENTTSSRFRSAVIPVTPGAQLHVISSNDRSTILAVVKSFTKPSNGDVPDFSADSEWSSVKEIASTRTYFGYLPSDAAFLIVYLGSGARIPALLEIGGYDYVKGALRTVSQLSMLCVKSYPTLSDMQSDTSLTVGMVVRTLGRYAVSDGGGAYYRIAETRPANYHPMLANGLYAILVIENNEVNGAALGAIGDNDTITKVNYAIQCAVDYNANLRFPADITIGGGITIPDTLNDKIITFDGTITYSGTVAALTVENCKNITIKGNAIICTNSPTVGLRYLQNGSKTLYNVNSKFNRIEAYIGIRITATTWGILECDIDVDRIISNSSGLLCECLQEDSERASFIGQMRYKFQHIVSSNNYAIVMRAETSPSTITGAFIDSVSFESSKNGIMLRGDCKLIKIYNIRCLEDDDTNYFINATGALRYCEFSFTSPVRVDKLYISSTYGRATKPVLVTGGIYSPSDYRFADWLMVTSSGKTYGKTTPSLARRNGNDFVFGEDSASYRLYDHLINDSGDEITYTLTGYLSPFGVDTIYVRQNKTDGSVVKVIVGSATVFDGSTVTDEGQTDYKITAVYYDSIGTVDYLTVKM